MTIWTKFHGNSSKSCRDGLCMTSNVNPMLGLEGENNTWDCGRLGPGFVAINTAHVELFYQMTGITELVVLTEKSDLSSGDHSFLNISWLFVLLFKIKPIRLSDSQQLSTDRAI